MGSGIYSLPSAYPVCNFSTVNTYLVGIEDKKEEEGERRNSSSCWVMGAFLVVSSEESAYMQELQEICRLNLWIGKVPWRRAWQPTLVYLPGESPWTEAPDGLQSTGSQRVGHDWSNWTSTHAGWVMRNLFKHCNKARLCRRVSIAAASIDNLLRKMAEPKEEPPMSILGFSTQLALLWAAQRLCLEETWPETGRQEGAGVLPLENLKVSELARHVSKKPSPV